MFKPFILCILLASLVACNDDFSVEKASGNWQLTTIDGQPAPMARGDQAVTLQIQADGTFSGQAPVNRYFGQLKFDGKKFVGAPVGSTMMAGPPEQMQAEQAFFKSLNNAESARLTADQLHIVDADGKHLVFQRVK